MFDAFSTMIAKVRSSGSPGFAVDRRPQAVATSRGIELQHASYFRKGPIMLFHLVLPASNSALHVMKRLL
jgi:hypothetical protein